MSPLGRATKVGEPSGRVVCLFFLQLSTAIMCRMLEYFDDPDTFKPSRFDRENRQ